MTSIEFLLTFLYFFTGYTFLVSFLGNQRHTRTLAGAFPIGYCIWGLCSLLTAVIPFFPKNAYGFSTTSAVIVAVIATAFFFTFSWRRHATVNLKIVPAFAFTFMILATLYGLFTILNISVLSADSLSHIHPQEGLATMANVRGFNSTHAAFAGLAGQDRYFFAYHTLFTLSLLLLMGEYIYWEIRQYTSSTILSISMALIGPTLLASCHMTAINAFYVNNHVLVAVLIILSLSIFTGATNTNGETKNKKNLPVFLGVILVALLCLLRLEGALIGLVLLIVMLGHPCMNSTSRSRAFLLYAVLSVPFLIYMISSTAGKVTVINFIIVTTVIISVALVFSLKKLRIAVLIQDQAHKLVIAGLVACSTLFLITDDGRMTWALHWVIHNMFDESYWGFVHHILLVCIPLLILLKLLDRQSGTQTTDSKIDRILLFYIAALLLIVFMTKFHGSRLGWSSSQNRMLLHFLPVGITWAMIRTGIGLSARSR